MRRIAGRSSGPVMIDVDIRFGHAVSAPEGLATVSKGGDRLGSRGGGCSG